MCGIAEIVKFREESQLQKLKAMTDTIGYRGSDGEAVVRHRDMERNFEENTCIELAERWAKRKSRKFGKLFDFGI